MDIHTLFKDLGCIMSKLEIKPICSKDSEFIGLLYKDFHLYSYALGSKKESFIKTIYKYLKRENLQDYFSCIVFNDKKVGFLKINVIENTNVLWIRSFLILEGWQNEGIGTKALKTLEDFYSKKLNIKHVYVSVLYKNKKGIEFWVKNNYKEIKKIEKEVEINSILEEIIVMRKTI
jgi:predicted acetyltransferase